MAYDDPRHVRDHVVKVSLNEEEMELLEALAKYNKRQKSAFARQKLMDGLRRALSESSTQQQLLAS